MACPLRPRASGLAKSTYAARAAVLPNGLDCRKLQSNPCSAVIACSPILVKPQQFKPWTRRARPIWHAYSSLLLTRLHVCARCVWFCRAVWTVGPAHTRRRARFAPAATSAVFPGVSATEIRAGPAHCAQSIVTGLASRRLHETRDSRRIRTFRSRYPYWRCQPARRERDDREPRRDPVGRNCLAGRQASVFPGQGHNNMSATFDAAIESINKTASSLVSRPRKANRRDAGMRNATKRSM